MGGKKERKKKLTNNYSNKQKIYKDGQPKIVKQTNIVQLWKKSAKKRRRWGEEREKNWKVRRKKRDLKFKESGFPSAYYYSLKKVKGTFHFFCINEAPKHSTVKKKQRTPRGKNKVETSITWHHWGGMLPADLRKAENEPRFRRKGYQPIERQTNRSSQRSTSSWARSTFRQRKRGERQTAVLPYVRLLL